MSKRLMKRFYQELTIALHHAGVAFWDTEVDGPGVTIYSKGRSMRYVIVVGGSKSLKKRLFYLAHEIGHAIDVDKFTDGRLVFKLRKKPSMSERKANETACKILDALDPKLSKQFEKHYNEMHASSGRNKFKRKEF